MLPCPYCGKKLGKLTSQHCKLHGRTLAEVRKEYPILPTWFTGIVATSKYKKPEKDKLVEGYYSDKRATVEVGKVLKRRKDE